MKSNSPIHIEVGNLLIKDILSLTPQELGSFITGVMAYYSPEQAAELVANIRDPDFQAARKKKLVVEQGLTTEN